ncbi:Free methionine-R-sulfoxide reductase [Raoultella terrigena]|uniref:Free methionine-R-sulfoxide reductase n=1 Tax=Raoultella terrigena TaxID=577 RepID=A0A485BWL5_RAOTE|nr:Free methionine-R-sulfoxide reductase [Raoultella terrigena]
MLILLGSQCKRVRQLSDYIMNKTEFYADLNRDFQALMAGETSFLATISNTSALLFERLSEVNWAGFYLLEGDTLVLGPFQGKLACVRIPVGRGVCGTAVSQNRVQRVEDVHAFDGHIACDARQQFGDCLPAAGERSDYWRPGYRQHRVRPASPLRMNKGLRNW